MPRFILLLFLSLSSGLTPPSRVLLVESTDAAAARAVLEPLSIAVEAVDRIDDAALGARLADYDGVIIRSSNRIGPSMIASAARAGGRLRVIGRAGVGVDNIDLGAARAHGVAVVNAPGANSAAVAEHTIALALAVSRRVAAAHASVRAGRWERGAFQGALLRGKTLGVVGGGRIGREVARLGEALGMRVMSASARGAADAPAAGHAHALDDVLRAADVLTLHVPLAEETANLVDAAALGAMRPGACVINAARGGVVDERALLDALEAGALGGAALDVYANEGAPLDPVVLALARLPNVVCTPHIGAATAETAREVSREVAENVARVVQGGVPEDGLVVAPDGS